jgi:hypothetical protein
MGQLEQLLLASVVGAPDERYRIHAGRSTCMLAEQLEPREVDQDVGEQVGAIEKDAGELRHHLAGALDLGGRK